MPIQVINKCEGRRKTFPDMEVLQKCIPMPPFLRKLLENVLPKNKEENMGSRK